MFLCTSGIIILFLFKWRPQILIQHFRLRHSKLYLVSRQHFRFLQATELTMIWTGDRKRFVDQKTNKRNIEFIQRRKMFTEQWATAEWESAKEKRAGDLMDLMFCFWQPHSRLLCKTMSVLLLRMLMLMLPLKWNSSEFHHLSGQARINVFYLGFCFVHFVFLY